MAAWGSWGRGVGLVLLALLVAVRAHAVLPGLPPDAMCASEASRFEHIYGIPPQLLDAISVVESGRWDTTRKATVAWPWTVTAAGQGKFFPTRAEAVAEVRRLRAAGVKSIDVGCMQVNLQYHPEAFANLEEAFEPASNVAYAARFLKGLYGSTNHWPTAASYYHSQTPELAAAYRAKLMKIWSPGQTAVASAPSVPHTEPWQPRPPASSRVAQLRREWEDRTAAGHDEARRIADAYRQARLAEYQLRRSRMMDARRAAGLSAHGY